MFQQLSFVLLASTLLLSACGDLTTSNPSGSNTSGATAIASPTTGGSSTSSGSTSTNGFPASVKSIALEANKTFEVKGNLDQGETITDLTWASNSSVACFPATQNNNFKAKHSLFHTALPPRSIMKIKLIPDDTSGAAMSLYAYQIGTTNYSVVPKLSSAVTCEADHIKDRPVVGKVEDGTRSVELNATTNPYNAVIGVSGAEGASGGYTLQITLEQ